jgi:hypothetical protein
MLSADTGPLVAILNAKDQPPRHSPAPPRRFRSPATGPVVTDVSDFL